MSEKLTTLAWKDLSILATEYTDPSFDLVKYVKAALAPHPIETVTIVKKSLDARQKHKIVYHLQVQITSTAAAELLKDFSFLSEAKVKEPFSMALAANKKQPRHKPLIIGSGPAGTFAALCLQEGGIACHIVERGEEVAKRLRTVNKLRSRGELDPESNFCFGEGGAGTFSDGKLTCGRNHPLIEHIFKTFHKYGAPEDILYEAHPHIGTDHLMRIALNMRKSLIDSGSEFSFQKIFTGFRSGGDSARYIVTFADGSEIPTDHLILAIGHSARDTYQKLLDLGLAMAPKPFAIGARIEHPQDVINEIQFGQCELPTAAEYKLVARAGERGIWTFCMCPGGHLLPTPAQTGHLAINGMSYHARNSGFANAAVVVNILREDFYKGHVLDGVRFQEELERKAFRAGGENYHSPAQRLVDFLQGRESKGTLESTYKPGIHNARMDTIFPDFVTNALKTALHDYNKRMRGYISDRGLIVGLESKTSAPITMLRTKELESISHPRVFPCGEGAGFAGGIISAALDGLRIGQAVHESL